MQGAPPAPRPSDRTVHEGEPDCAGSEWSGRREQVSVLTIVQRSVIGSLLAMAVTADLKRPPPAARPLASSLASGRTLDRWEIVLLVLFAAVSLWVLGYDVWQAAVHGRVWTGSMGIFPGDQLQYMAWVRDASHHVLISDLYVLHPTPHDYLEPLVALAGGLTALGLAPWAALLAFQPLAVGALFFAIRAYLHRSVTGRWERRAALALALFAGPFVVLFSPFGAVAAEWLPFWTWGYLPSVFAIAAQVGALVAYDQAMKDGRRLWMAPVLGLLASWLHPWQGEELLLILLVYELGRRTRVGQRLLEPSDAVRRRPRALPWLTALATLLPLIYYVLLDRLDPIWDMAQDAAALHKAPAAVLLPLLPLLAGAALGWRGRPRSFLVTVSRIWPLAAVAVYGLCEAGLGSTPRHAFAGITIPLAVLTVIGVRRIRTERFRPPQWAAALFLVAVTIPTCVIALRSVPGHVSSAFITPDAQRALAYLASDPEPGGVLTTRSLGAVTPGVTGRHTYVGNSFWSLPLPRDRQRRLLWLFYRHPNPLQAQGFVLGTGARFVLAPCQVSTDLQRDLAPLLASVHHFGCATVYTLRPSGQTD